MYLRNLFTLLCLALTLGAQAQDNPYRVYTRQLPFSMPEVAAPVFPKKTVSLTRYGAKGDGKTLCTEAFSKAIDELSVKPGQYKILYGTSSLDKDLKSFDFTVK